MIFVTVGMHHQGFDRLIRAMDQFAAATDEPVVMQIGSATYQPTHAEWFPFSDGERVDALIASARVVVSHAGAGTIISAFRYRRPLVMVPRRAVHGEHVDDHQIELAHALAATGKVALVPEPTVETLLDGIRRAEHLHPHKQNGHRLATAISQLLHGETSNAATERTQTASE